MTIMFITFIILAALAFKLGVYSALFSIFKFAFASVFFVAGGLILWLLWKRVSRGKARTITAN